MDSLLSLGGQADNEITAFQNSYHKGNIFTLMRILSLLIVEQHYSSAESLALKLAVTKLLKSKTISSRRFFAAMDPF
jgi:hypothetical protein